MATVTQFSGKKILVIDDVSEVRQQLQMTLASIGFETLHIVSSIKEAMDRIALNHYEVILCDYNLGDTTDGQQFLEYVRLNDKISKNTIFIMVTAENSYERVIAAVECIPDDYILKPFTAAHFIARLEHLLNRQYAFKKIDAAYDKKNWALVIQECDKLLVEKNKYYIDLCKVKAIALQKADLFEHAIEVYEEVLALRDLPWATLGLARVKARLGKLDESKELAEALVRENPQFLAGYDFASELSLQKNDADKALDYLYQAIKINPDNMSRTRSITTMELAKGDFDSAENLIKNIIKKHRHSPVRDAGDYALLSRSLAEQGKFEDAHKSLDDAKRYFRDANSALIIAASSSLAYSKSGEQDKAANVLEEVLKADIHSLPPNVAMSIAEACYATGKEEVANDLLKHVLQNNPDDTKLQSKVKMAHVMAGKSLEESNNLIQDSAKEIIKINNDGVRKAQEGQYQEAMDLILGAAKRLPLNVSVISNAALIVAVSASKISIDEATIAQCVEYRNRLAELSPSHPKLSKIDEMLTKLKVAA
jgi:DNA-binding response OmpR family regulator/cytochrome c-type biogenesis protein CcmH/NrfG